MSSSSAQSTTSDTGTTAQTRHHRMRKD
jgi:hypothetical protein